MKGILFQFVFLVLCSAANAQSTLLPSWSPYGGVYNLNFNPAISDARHFADVNLFAVSLSNASAGVDRDITTLYPFDLKARYALNGSSAKIFLHENAGIMGPSAIISGGKKRKNEWAFGIATGLNEVLDVDNIDSSLYRSFAMNQRGQLPQSTFSDQQFFYASWAEIKPTVGYTVYNREKHFVKVGGSIRILQGMSAFNMGVGEMSVINRSADSAIVTMKSVEGFRSEALNMEFDEVTKKANGASPSFSAEIGVVYEYRALRDSFQYEMNEQKWIDHENIKYLLSGGLSFAPSVKIQYLGQAFEFSDNTASLAYAKIQSASSLDSVYTNLLDRFSDNKKTDATTKMNLPSRLNVFADANIFKGIGATLTATIHPGQKPGYAENIYQPDQITFAPRYDQSLYGASLPISWQRWDPMSRDNILMAGLALRFGPISVAAHYNLAASQISQVNVGLKIPVRYKRLRDKDGDLVDDTRDLCIAVPGQYTAMGCPDSDMDSIPNDQDRCQWEKGPKKFRGCPDGDGDGIPDIDDRCKDIFGLSQFEGCPDNDGDGVPDDVDECDTIPGPPQSMGCPDFDNDGVYDPWDDCDSIAGPKEFKGCPDRDGDGILDMDDDCPDEKGDLLDGGCPDRDNDGTLDKNDYCPDEKGSWRNHGCPNEDSDGDGLFDFQDDCPDDYGPKSNHGCPKKDKFPNQKKQLVLRINNGFDLDVRNAAELDSIASLMKRYPDYSVRIIGFADSLGTDEEKKTLSVQRANSARERIEQNGIEGSRIFTSAEGNTDPLHAPEDGENNFKFGRIEVYVLFKEK